jgi:hypothetical protein
VSTALLFLLALQGSPCQDMRSDPENAGPAGNAVDEESYVFPRMRGLFRQAEVENRAANIKEPGPDTCDFPNSPYTLPAGRFYIELQPLDWIGQTGTQTAAYTFQGLYRYGVTDYWEFRVFSNGFQYQLPGDNSPSSTGFNPIVFDMKVHLQEEIKEWFIPALGLEAYIQTNFGSPELSQGIQPGLSLLAMHSFGENWTLNWNAGISGSTNGIGANIYTANYSMSLAREITERFGIYFHGYVNDGSLPKFVTPISGGTPNSMVVGAGMIWYPYDRVAIWGSANGGVNHNAPDAVFIVGTAFAF